MPHAHPSGFPLRVLDCANDGEGQALALREGAAFFQRSAGACPPRVLDCANDGEGQALALREGAAFFSS